MGVCRRQTGTSEFKSLIIAFSQVFRAIPTDPKLHQVTLILFFPPSKAINPKSDTRSLPPFTHETNVQKEKEASVDKDRLMLAILTSSVYRFIMSLLSTPLSELNLNRTDLDAESDSDTSPQVRTHSDHINEVLAH